MKILHVIDSLNTGGAEKVCLNLIKLLLDNGHQADCMIISSRGALFRQLDNRSKEIFLNRKNKFDPRLMKKCAEIAGEYNIVHVHMRHTWVYVKLSCFLFNKTVKLIFHDHYGDIKINRKPTFRLKWIFKPQFYIGVSRELTEWAVDVLGINRKNVFFLGNTIIPDYNFCSKYSGDWVMISNLRQTKNILFAEKLAEKMMRSLVIFGNSDGSSYASDVTEFAEKSEYIQIVPDETEPQKYLSNFKLALHTSFSETAPLVLLEYLAHGLPFVTYNTGEVVNQIRKELPEFIASSFKIEEWVKKINFIESKIFSDNENLKIRLQKIFMEKFSPQNYIEQCLIIYKSVLTS